MREVIIWVVAVPAELDKTFRKVITKKHGGKIKRGDLKDSIIEAVQDWNRKQSQKDNET